MSQYYLLQDQKKCIGCLSCEAHCKTFQGVPTGPRLSRIIPVGPRSIGSVPRMAYVFMPCFHCEDPWCVSVCPTGAMQKRPKDGIVFIDSSLCVGCKSCMTACPWGAPQWNPQTGKVVKCNYCMDRIDRGLKPSCVTKCVTHCLHFGRASEPEDSRRERFARSIAFTPAHPGERC
ncbi:MAG: 4Fe-4S dicluster domain-containing protein [Syntrophobacteraceae bacterium]